MCVWFQLKTKKPSKLWGDVFSPKTCEHSTGNIQHEVHGVKKKTGPLLSTDNLGKQGLICSIFKFTAENPLLKIDHQNLNCMTATQSGKQSDFGI